MELALLEVSLTGIRQDAGVKKNVLILKFPPSNFLRKWVRTSGGRNSEWLFPDPKDKTSRSLYTRLTKSLLAGFVVLTVDAENTPFTVSSACWPRNHSKMVS
ncbi:hypothetical protein [Pseudomonas jessenii]|uniref:hypothetical protein n=1 Tax=Pseudomonas jessenii TaxID=77298 RepID=UPI0039E14310